MFNRLARSTLEEERRLEIVHMRIACLAIALGPALIVVLSAGCASTIPAAIRDQGPALTVAQVQYAAEPAIGEPVRWGGTILAVRNLSESTEIDVLARPLAGDGEPRASAKPIGRFMATVSGFLDPAEYPKDRRLTVFGPVTGVVVRDIGEYPYRYPVVRATSRYLWPVEHRPAASPGSIYASGWWGRGPPYWPYPSPFYGPLYRPWYGYW